MASQPDPMKTLAAIAKLLGLPKEAAADAKAIADAVIKLAEPISAEQARARRTLSTREVAACRAKGVDVARYAATKAAIRAKSSGARRP